MIDVLKAAKEWAEDRNPPGGAFAHEAEISFRAGAAWQREQEVKAATSIQWGHAGPCRKGCTCKTGAEKESDGG